MQMAGSCGSQESRLKIVHTVILFDFPMTDVWCYISSCISCPVAGIFGVNRQYVGQTPPVVFIVFHKTQVKDINHLGHVLFLAASGLHKYKWIVDAKSTTELRLIKLFNLFRKFSRIDITTVIISRRFYSSGGLWSGHHQWDLLSHNRSGCPSLSELTWR